jgi:uncharacterized protein YkwD
MRRRAALLVTLALGLAAAATQPAGAGVASAEAAPAARPDMERIVVAQVNRVRARHGLRTRFTWATTMRSMSGRAARGHSRFLAARGVLQHEDARGRPFWVRLVAAGYPRDRAMGENLAQVGGCGAGPARRAVALWMGSPGHRANILSPRYRAIGVGAAAAGGCEAAAVTADFGG